MITPPNKSMSWNITVTTPKLYIKLMNVNLRPTNDSMIDNIPRENIMKPVKVQMGLFINSFFYVINMKNIFM